MVGHGGSSAGSYLADPTSPIPSHCASIVVTSTLRVSIALNNFTSSSQIQTWSRKASSCGFHLLPVPSDPFALPFTPSSDPLRGPIFVPLNLEHITEPHKDLFEGKVCFCLYLVSFSVLEECYVQHCY